MKRILFTSILSIVMVFGSLSGQTSQGTFMLGSSTELSITSSDGNGLMGIGYTTVKDKSDADGYEEGDPTKMLSFNLTPRAGIFVADNFALGLDISLGARSYKFGEDDKSNSIYTLAGPFVRYYIPTGKVMPFFESGGGLGIIYSKSEYIDYTGIRNEYESTTAMKNFRIGAGAAIMVGNSVSFYALVGYKWLQVKDMDDNEDNDRENYSTIGLELGITVFLGNIE